MDTRYSSIQKTSQHSQCSCNMVLVEWKSIEMIEDFLNNSFDVQNIGCLAKDSIISKDNIPMHCKQVFI